jgi:hypothetical protein
LENLEDDNNDDDHDDNVAMEGRCESIAETQTLFCKTDIVYGQNTRSIIPQRSSVCDPAKIFLTSKFSYLLFCNPTHKTKTGTANRWETTTGIANHLNQSL